MIRYHSFYPWHREGAYRHLMSDKEFVFLFTRIYIALINVISLVSYQLLAAVRAFNPYDLYSKSDERVDSSEVRPYYEALIAKYFPPEVEW